MSDATEIGSDMDLLEMYQKLFKLEHQHLVGGDGSKILSLLGLIYKNDSWQDRRNHTRRHGHA